MSKSATNFSHFTPTKSPGNVEELEKRSAQRLSELRDKYSRISKQVVEESKKMQQPFVSKIPRLACSIERDKSTHHTKNNSIDLKTQAKQASELKIIRRDLETPSNNKQSLLDSNTKIPVVSPFIKDVVFDVQQIVPSDPHTRKMSLVSPTKEKRQHIISSFQILESKQKSDSTGSPVLSLGKGFMDEVMQRCSPLKRTSFANTYVMTAKP